MFEKLIEYLIDHLVSIDEKIGLMKKYSDIEIIQNIKTSKTFNFIYHYRKNIHKILYDEENFIKMKGNKSEENLYKLFYLILLIKDNSDVVNYIYDLKYIENVNNFRKKNKNVITSFILSMIIIQLISNFKETDNYDKSNEEQLKIIEKENIKIRNCFNFSGELNMNINEKLIEDNNIEEIYLNIIISLLEKEKLEDFKYASNIFEQLGLKTINITENIYNELKKIFGSDENYIKKYMIRNFEDICDEKKINFYYIIFNYIFKDILYLYNIPFLHNLKRTLFKIVKSGADRIFYLGIKDSELRNRLEFNIKFICDLKYYQVNYLKKIDDLFRSIQNQELIEQNKKEKSDDENEEKENNGLEDKNSIFYEKDIETKEIIYDDSNICNLKIDEDSTNHNDIIKPKVDESQSVIILEESQNNKNNIEDSIIGSSVIIPQSSTFLNKNNVKAPQYNDKESQIFISEFEYKYDNEMLEIMEFEQIIGNHGKSADFVKQIDNFYVSSGEDTNLSIYDYNYKRQLRRQIRQSISSVSELTSTKTEEMKKDKNIITCTKDNLITTTINSNTFTIKSKKYDQFHIPCNFILEVRKNNYIVCGSKGVFIYYDLFSKIVNTRNIVILKENYTGGIVLDDGLFALTSNEIVKNGVNNLVIYNVKSKKIQSEIKGYSFNSSSTGLCIMTREDPKKGPKSYNQTLLCACKKNKIGQKNGILLVNINSENKINISNSFYDTGNFEVYCFCPLMKEDKDAKLRIFQNNHFLIKTDYFLVGGYDNDRKRGMIKLYKLKYNESNETSIEYIQEIKPEKRGKFEGFKKPISCMIQSKKDGKILITSWDGNVYLFSNPKFESFLDSEEEENNFNNFFNIKEDKGIVLEA